MPSVASIVAFAGFAILAVATPVDKSSQKGRFTVHQVAHGTTKKIGSLALQKAYKKYNAPVPTRVAVAAASATASGTVAADPEPNDTEYLCPVNVGGTTMMLDFDTGSSDL